MSKISGLAKAYRNYISMPWHQDAATTNPTSREKKRGAKISFSEPWYRLGLEYDGKEGGRINDHHLSLEEKAMAHTVFKEEVD